MAPARMIVFGNGERPPDLLKEMAKDAELVGVDGGARWILRWGLVPHRVVGDLDSLDERTRNYTDGFGAPIEKTEDETNRSDLARVVDQIAADPPDEVVFTGCVGTRLDHVMGLFAGLGRLALAGVRVRAVERWGTAHVAAPGHDVVLADLAAERASFFPLTPAVDGLVLSGFDAGEDPPARIEPPFDGLAGVPIVSDPAEVSVASGAVLVIVPRREAPGGPAAAGKEATPTFRLGTLERTE